MVVETKKLVLKGLLARNAVAGIYTEALLKQIFHLAVVFEDFTGRFKFIDLFEIFQVSSD
jgi:hypothetical protein